VDGRGFGLEGVRVVDRLGDLAGAFCAHRLATFGAECWTTYDSEDPALPAVYRAGISVTGPDADLGPLIAAADIVIDGDATDSDPLTALVRPESVRVVVTSFGRTGPYAGFAATDLTIDAYAGAMSSTGARDRAPITLGYGLVSTYVGAVAAAAGATEWLLAEATGQGSVIDLAWVDTLAASMDRRALQLLIREYTGWDADRNWGEVGDVIKDVFACRDGQVFISAYGWHIRPIAKLIGPAADAFLAKPVEALRSPGREAFRAILGTWLAGRAVSEVVARANAVNWPVVPAHTVRTALFDEWLAASGIVSETADGQAAPASGIRMDWAPGAGR
jgi:benzylsuccinate CoA-transferase BbsE subunit